MEYLIIFILSAAFIFFAVRYYLLKKQLKSVFKQLNEEQIRLVTIELVDHDIENIVQEINDLLEQIQQTVIKGKASSAVLKSSIADISHDMKTPLTSVIGYLQLAEKECEDEKVGEIIKTCLERTHYLNSLINDFFELSVIESQGCTPKLESVDVAGVISEQILASYPIFEEKNISPHFENSDKIVMAYADANMLNRVIQNLISNGVKYASGDISFVVCCENEKAIITVSNPVNTYIDTTHIFDRFYTQDKSRSKGNGIGLYICRQFTEAMGGNINAEIDGNFLSIKVVLNSVSLGN
ncbi:MAG: HAMP domain-containing histidine kinase [Ruminococcus sp.]|nr:HAMP domain-containing histidine kinase [Ruminococcus sp.]